MLMRLKILKILVVCLALGCGTTKVIYEEKSNNSSEKSSETVKQIIYCYYPVPRQEPERANIQAPRSIRLFLCVKDGVIVKNSILSDNTEALKYHSVRKEQNQTILFIQSVQTHHMYVFRVPHKNGEFVVEGERQ